MKCKNCNGNMVGDGFSAVLHCENLAGEDSERIGVDYMAPDEGPVYCESGKPRRYSLSETKKLAAWLPTPTEERILRHVIDFGPTTTKRIATMTLRSRQYSHRLLTNLVRKGWLKKVDNQFILSPNVKP